MNQFVLIFCIYLAFIIGHALGHAHAEFPDDDRHDW